MNELPHFSVVIATYNRDTLLNSTIASVLQQTFNQFELLIVDDGSTDETKEVVLKYANTDRRVKYIYQKNAERGAARNNGYRHSLGRFVVFFDSDDIMTHNYLEDLYHLIETHPGYNLYAGKYVFEEQGKIIPSSVSPYSMKDYGLELVLYGNPIGTLFCVRRNDEFILFPEKRELAAMEDWMCLVYNLRHSRLFLGDFIGCRVNNHDERSMRFNQAIIKKRLMACDELINTVDLTHEEKTIICTYTYQFCAIHAYLDFNRKQALHYIRKAIVTGGAKKQFFKTMLKILIGKRTINQIKKFKLI